MTILRLLLPVLWALVATAIGVILYKTSSAVFDGSTNTKSPAGTKKRKLSLAGSVVIAALAYVGMMHATPGEALQDPGGDVAVEQVQRCRDSFALIQATLRLGSPSSQATISAMRRYVAECEPVLAGLEKQ